MASEPLLGMADVASLTNQERLPVVTSLTCYVSLFWLPGLDSLGEELVLHPDGGAIAVWAPTGWSPSWSICRRSTVRSATARRRCCGGRRSPVRS